MEGRVWEKMKRILEEWLETTWVDALLELIGGLLFFFTMIVYIIFFLAIC